ncbi:hypothetical protein [Pseudomonas sp. C9-3]|uniref:hypothetical protein n=1 Tax=Pseudomonas sp. C9-3 TaxID=3078264 RepID=UPI0028F02EE6|nr:hypothetical protein [Pseudomonas sp. C9-3]
MIDEFIPNVAELRLLEDMSRSGGFDKVVLLGSYAVSEKDQLFKWAWSRRVGLLDIIEKPTLVVRLREILGRMVVAVDLYNGKSILQ